MFLQLYFIKIAIKQTFGFQILFDHQKLLAIGHDKIINL